MSVFCVDSGLLTGDEKRVNDCSVLTVLVVKKEGAELSV